MKSISSTKLFTQYIKLFPEVSFPLTLHQDAHHDFSIQNQGIRKEYLDQYVHPFIEKRDDEFTEFIPCFVLKEEKHFIAVVLWRAGDRKSTRLNSSHVAISYAVFCLKKKRKT